MTLHVFSGPSLDLDEVKRLRPEAQVRPPVQRGDLVRLAPQRGDTLVIIDGFFFHRPTIQHMEILDVLRRGVHVIGASSMGALRAAELESEGMVGVGRIFEMFRSGEIQGDDEVGIIHDPETYRARSDAMVSIRHNLARALAAGAVTEPSAAAAIADLRRRWFGERTYARAVQIVEKAGGADEAARLKTYWAQHVEDLKRSDALQALRELPAARPDRPALRATETSFAYGLRSELQLVNERWRISRHDVLRYAQVREPNMPAIYRQAALCEVMCRLGHAVAPGDARDQDCLTRLVEARVLAAGATLQTLDRVIYPLRVHPGIPSYEFLIAALEANGMLARARDELLRFVADALSVRASDDVIRFGRSQREFTARLYADYWGIAEAELAEEVRRRGFADLHQFFTTAGKVLLTAKISSEVHARSSDHRDSQNTDSSSRRG